MSDKKTDIYEKKVKLFFTTIGQKICRLNSFSKYFAAQQSNNKLGCYKQILANNRTDIGYVAYIISDQKWLANPNLVTFTRVQSKSRLCMQFEY